MSGDCRYHSSHGISTQCKKVKFEKTPKMSTYLVCFVIGDYGHISGKTENGVEITLHAPHTYISQG